MKVKVNRGEEMKAFIELDLREEAQMMHDNE